MAKVPDIRFQNFSCEWEECTFGDKLLALPYKQFIKQPEVNGTFPVIQQGDVPVLGFANGEPISQYEDKVVFGDHTVSLYKPTSPFFVATDGLRIFSIKDFPQSFLYAMFEKYKPKSHGYTRHTSYLNESTIKYPRNTEEKKVIGDFFKTFDDLISSKQLELDMRRQMKASLFEKMFPVDGETSPQIRFEGFKDPWKKVALGRMGNTYTGLSGKSKEDFGHGKAKYITYMNVFSSTVASYSGTDFIEIDSKQNQVKYGDVLFTTSSETPDEVGMSSIWLYEEENVYLNSFCFGYRPTTKVYPYYLAYALKSPRIRQNFYLLAQGISRFNISKQKAMEIELDIPNYDEQQKVGDFFLELDKAISALAEQITKLKIMKQALLMKMFVM